MGKGGGATQVASGGVDPMFKDYVNTVTNYGQAMAASNPAQSQYAHFQDIVFPSAAHVRPYTGNLLSHAFSDYGSPYYSVPTTPYSGQIITKRR